MNISTFTKPGPNPTFFSTKCQIKTLEHHMASFFFPSGNAQFFSIYTGLKPPHTSIYIGFKFVSILLLLITARDIHLIHHCIALGLQLSCFQTHCIVSICKNTEDGWMWEVTRKAWLMSLEDFHIQKWTDECILLSCRSHSGWICTLN